MYLCRAGEAVNGIVEIPAVILFPGGREKREKREKREGEEGGRRGRKEEKKKG
jgi:hypothetical protein